LKVSNIKDALLIAVLLFIGWKTYEIESIQPTIVEKTEYKTVTNEVVKPVTNTVFKAGKDTVIYVTQLIRDTTRITDTIKIEAWQAVVNDTIRLDSLGYIAGMHIVNGSISQSMYYPYLKQKERIIEKTYVKDPIKLYANIAFGKDYLAPGITIASKEYEAGYNWDLINNRHYIRTGYRIFQLYQKQ
jgi:hypothetical protein